MHLLLALLLRQKEIPEKSSLRKDVFVWADGLIRDVVQKGDNSMAAGGCSNGWHHIHSQKAECGQEVDLGYKTLRFTLSDPLLPERGHASFTFHTLDKQHRPSRTKHSHI